MDFARHATPHELSDLMSVFRAALLNRNASLFHERFAAAPSRADRLGRRNTCSDHRQTFDLSGKAVGHELHPLPKFLARTPLIRQQTSLDAKGLATGPCR